MSQQMGFLVAFAAAFGAAEAIRQTQSSARRSEHRSRKNNLVVHCPKSSRYSTSIEGRHVILSGDKVRVALFPFFPQGPSPHHQTMDADECCTQLYVDTGTEYDVPFGHPFAGYYLPFPDTPFSGLVSTISDDPPVMRWIYVDRGTYEVKFGTRPWAEANFKGPFDCTRQDRRMTLGSWEGFLAVQEGNFWALYFDLDDDRLQSRVAEGTPVLEIQLQRVEMKTQKPVAPEEPPEENGKKEENDGKKEEDACNGAENGDGLESPEID